jgi:hypothetical protein
MREGKIYGYRVTIDKRYQETITFDSGVELYQDTWENHEQKVTLTGTVAYAPPTDTVGLGIQKGDKIYFRYDVVAESEVAGGHRVYENEILFPDGHKEWFVAPYAVIAVERGGLLYVPDGTIICKNKTVKAAQSSLIYIPDQYTEKKSDCLMEVLVAGNNSGVLPGQTVVVIPEMVQHYNFHSHYNDDVCFVKSKYIISVIHDN